LMVEPTDPVNEPVVSLLAIGVGPPVGQRCRYS